jgi:hypothetical protein
MKVPLILQSGEIDEAEIPVPFCSYYISPEYGTFRSFVFFINNQKIKQRLLLFIFVSELFITDVEKLKKWIQSESDRFGWICSYGTKEPLV